MLSRRDAVASIAGLSSLGLAPRVLGQTGSLRVRKNFNDLTERDPDYQAFVQGVRMMRQRSDMLSWEWQRWHHDQFFRQHGTWRFLPWHRTQLAQFERIIAALTGYENFALPYWDFTTNPFLPLRLFQNPVLADPTRTARPDTNFIGERWNFSSRKALTTEGPFHVFAGTPGQSGAVEAFAHNAIHVIVGGNMSSVTTAPVDPIFWLHHANIDRVWATRQAEVGYEYPSEFLDETFTGFAGPNGPIGTVSARDVISTQGIGYQYDSPYPHQVFNLTAGLVRKGFIRKFTGAKKTVVTEDVATKARPKITIPRDLVDALRNDADDRLNLYGEATVRLKTPNLAQKVVRIRASAQGGKKHKGKKAAPVVLAAAPAFFHPSGHMGHEGHDTWGFGFSFENELINLIGETDGEILIEAETIELNGKSPKISPEFVELSVEFQLKTHEWVASA